jgi:hypothetical protein
MADQIGDDISRAFSAHPHLSARVVALLKARLKDRLRKILKQGDIATARRLARLATRDEVPGAVYELSRKRYTLTRIPRLRAVDALFWRETQLQSAVRDTLTLRPGDYLRPTVDALFWRDNRLQSAVRADPQHARLLPAYQGAARHEASWRACIFIELLSELAKMTTQFPDESAVAKVAGRARTAVKEWQTAEALRAHGFPDDAATRMQLADMHLNCARILAREYAREYRDALLLVTWWRLRLHFWFNGYRIAAALVSAALERDNPISNRHARHVVEHFLRSLEK